MAEPRWTHHRARLAGAARRGNTALVDEARRDLRAARAEDYILKLVDEAPALTELQRARLAALLLPARRGGAAA